MARSDELKNWLNIQYKLDKLLVHDIKNPISALSANISFLEHVLSDQAEDIQGALHDSAVAIDMLLRFADNLNFISEMEMEVGCNLASVSLSDFIVQGIRRNDKFAKSAGVELEAATDLAKGNANWQYQYAVLVLDNLTLCAIRHSPSNGVVTLSSKLVDENSVKISVTDQGSVITPELVEALFTREGQVEAKKLLDGRYGRGLGLYAAGLAVNLLGGKLTVEDVNGNVEFAMTVPLNQ